MVANHLGIKLNKKKLDAKSLLNLLPTFYKNFDEPFADAACFPLMAISEFAKKKVDVVMTGDGGDELFGGYSYYRIINYFIKFKNTLYFLNKLIPLSFISKYVENHKLELLIKLFNYDDTISKFSFMRSARKDFSNILIKNLRNSRFDIHNVFLSYAKEMSSNNSAVDKSMKLDILTTLNDSYLQKSDLSTMAYSLECRSPLLSKKIIEWSQTLETSQKVNFFNKKIILKKLAKKYLPEQIIKKKMGFELPIKNWLRNDLKEWAENLIFNEKNFTKLPFDQKTVKQLFNLHLSKKRDCHSYLWTILMVLKYNENHLIK